MMLFGGLVRAGAGGLPEPPRGSDLLARMNTAEAVRIAERGRGMRRRLTAACAGGLALLAIAAQTPPAQAALGEQLEPGDIIVLDILDDAVYHVDPSSGTVKTILSGSLVSSPRGVAVSREGLLYVSDTAIDWMLRIDPVTGEAVPFFAFSSPTFPEPGAMLIDDENGDLLVIEATKRQILRVDPATGVSSVEFQLEDTWFPIGLARDPDGKLIAVDRVANPAIETLAGIWRVDVAAGTQSEVLTSATFKSLRTVAVQSDGDILVADRGVGGEDAAVYCVPTSNLPASNCVPCVPPSCPPDHPEIFNDSFDGPNGVAVEAGDTVLVTDYSRGELVRLDPDGVRIPGPPLSSSFNGPYVVAVVPDLLDRRIHDPFLISDANVGGPDTDGVVYFVPSPAGNRTPIPGGPIAEPRAMAFADPGNSPPNCDLFVVDDPATILCRDLSTGSETGISTGEHLSDVSDIAVERNGQIVVADRGDEVIPGKVIRVDPNSGEQDPLTSELGEPTSLVVDGNGSIIVTDRDPPSLDGTPEDDSGLFRVNPLDGTVEQFSVRYLGSTPPVFIKFIEPKALARDFNGDLLLVAGDDATVPSQIYRVFEADNPDSFAIGVAFSTDLDGALADAVAMVVDANRDPIVAFKVAEPRRVDPLTGASTLIPVGGDFGDGTDLVYEGMPAPGTPDGDWIPDPVDNCPNDDNPDQADTDGDGDGDACDLDDDGDGVEDLLDNCPADPNGPAQGSCFAGDEGALCMAHSECDLSPTEGVCSLDQEDTDSDGVGDVCDPTPVPEPGAMALLFSGLALLRALVWHRRRGAATA
jgi:sugar lactone lactonase YvrE